MRRRHVGEKTENEGTQGVDSTPYGTEDSRRHKVEEEEEEEEEVVHNSASTSSSIITVSYTDWVMKFLMGLLMQYWNFVKSFLSSPSTSLPPLSEETREQMEAFKKEVLVPYNSQDPTHESLLLSLWNHSFPNQQLIDRISDSWKRLGFQGNNPSTDFRGGGIFALKNLLYLAEHYPKRFRELLEGTVHKEKFPFAISGLNITMLLFDLLGWGMRAHKFKDDPAAQKVRRQIIHLLFVDKSAVDMEGEHVAFNELYCHAFHLFDREWLSMTATTLDFTSVMERTRQKLEQFLTTVSSVQELVQRNKELNA